jgi:hypothetical protein
VRCVCCVFDKVLREEAVLGEEARTLLTLLVRHAESVEWVPQAVPCVVCVLCDVVWWGAGGGDLCLHCGRARRVRAAVRVQGAAVAGPAGAGVGGLPWAPAHRNQDGRGRVHPFLVTGLRALLFVRAFERWGKGMPMGVPPGHNVLRSSPVACATVRCACSCVRLSSSLCIWPPCHPTCHLVFCSACTPHSPPHTPCRRMLCSRRRRLGT